MPNKDEKASKRVEFEVSTPFSVIDSSRHFL